MERGTRADSEADAVLLWERMSLEFILTLMNDATDREEIREIFPLNEFLTSMKPGKKKTNLAFEVQMFSRVSVPHNLSHF